MSYYFLHQERKLPSLVVYVGLILLSIGMVFIIKNARTTSTSRATQSAPPKQIVISNITNASVTLSFTTQEAIATYVQYGKSGTDANLVAFDTRDTKKPSKRKIHYITLTNLTPNTTYSYVITIGSHKYQTDAYTFHTFGSIQKAPGHAPLFGRIVQKNLTPAQETLAVLSFPTSQTAQKFTALSGSDGEWMIAVPLVQDKNGNTLTLNDTTVVRIEFTDGDITSRVDSTLSQTSPLQTAVLGTDRQNMEMIGNETRKPEQQNLQIAFPQDNAVIPSRYIRFRGIAKAQSTLLITIDPAHIEQTISANENGIWEYQNTSPLQAGSYTFNIASSSEQASTSISFNIGKSGETVLGEATNSATLTPTFDPTTTTPTTIPTIGASEGTIPFATDIPTPTTASLTTPTRSANPTQTQSAIPSTGFANNILIVMASSFSLLGLILLLY